MNINDILSRADLPDIKARFETHFVKPRARLACWVWQRPFMNTDYGRFNIGSSRGYTASRVAWVLYRGPIPEGAQVLHRCDNPPCVNPRHLFLGTRTDNMRDMAAKMRSPLRKLTVEQVRAIRASPRNSRDIASELGMAYSTIDQLRSRQTWAWLD